MKLIKKAFQNKNFAHANGIFQSKYALGCVRAKNLWKPKGTYFQDSIKQIYSVYFIRVAISNEKISLFVSQKVVKKKLKLVSQKENSFAWPWGAISRNLYKS